MIDVLRVAVIVWLSGLMLGISSFALYLAFFTIPKDDTPLAGKALRYLGFGLVWAGVALIVGGILGAGIVGAMRAFGA